jgi:uncharacterized RDD family membrane protein YckC
MSSTPERDAPDQWGGSTQQSARPGEWGGEPQGAMPGQEQHGSAQSGGFLGQGPQSGSQGQWGSRPGHGGTPVNEVETRVTGRRIVQYLIDAFLVALIPSLVSIPFDRSSHTSLHIIGGIVFFGLFVLIGIWYWVIFPHGHNGQTFGMKLMGLRVISKDGGPANMSQLFIRWICLIFDAIPYTWPFTGLVGLIVILCSKHRQRIGDHLGRTLVIGTGSGVAGGAGKYGRPGAGMGRGMGTTSGSRGDNTTSSMGTSQRGMGTGQPGQGYPDGGYPPANPADPNLPGDSR